MTISLGAKDPDEVKNYTYSWASQLQGAEIVSATLSVENGTASLLNVANTLNGISFTVSGGKDCERFSVVSRIVTNETEPQTLEQVFTLDIKANASARGPSTNTKRQIVEMAYEECSLAGYEFNVTPEELFSGLRKLDALMSEWAVLSMDLGYNAPATFGSGDLDDYSGIPDAAVQGAAISLAIAIMPAMGKSMGSETRARYSRSMDAIKAMCAALPVMVRPRGVPRGAGNRNYGVWSPFLPHGRRC